MANTMLNAIQHLISDLQGQSGYFQPGQGYRFSDNHSGQWSGSLRALLTTETPALDTPLTELNLLSTDFETTGFDPKQDKLLSIGAVAIEGKEVILQRSFEQVISVDTQLDPKNVCVHQITDSEAARGAAIEMALDRLFLALKGKVMLVHYHPMERSFLRLACQSLYKVKLEVPMIDTLTMAIKWFKAKHVSYQAEDLTLANLRLRFGLPSHFAHNALADAIATAELYLVLVSQLQSLQAEPLVLGDVLV